ncbi:MAG: hypothetical protein J6D21_00605 [Clostridia bacterium]|nr:hypothetical protein [Clostridia bacterium]
MKKVVSILMLCVLLLVTLAACGSEQIPVAASPDVDYPPKFPEMDGVAPLTEQLVAEIETAWRNANGYDMKWFNWDNIVTRHFGVMYMGTVNGYVILLQNNAAGYAYKDGALYSLTDVSLDSASATVISDRLAALKEQISQRTDLDDPYATVLGDLPPALEECPYSRADLLAAIDASGEDDPFARSTYLGTYHGCIVFVSKNLWDEYGNGLVAGVAYDRGQDAFWVVRNDETCTLDEAFQRGYLTVDDIRTIMYYRYGERVPQR